MIDEAFEQAAQDLMVQILDEVKFWENVMQLCQNCGAVLLEQLSYCHKCGHIRPDWKERLKRK